MMTLEELEKTIISLPKKEYNELRHWFLERDWQEWDQEIGEDAKTGKLDFLVREAAEAKRKGNLREI